MNQQILHGTEVTTGRRKPSAIVAEYEAKTEAGGAGDPRLACRITDGAEKTLLEAR
jgi:hypothetical protein